MVNLSMIITSLHIGSVGIKSALGSVKGFNENGAQDKDDERAVLLIGLFSGALAIPGGEACGVCEAV